MENEIISILFNTGNIGLTETAVLENVLLRAEENILPAIEVIREELLRRAQQGERLMNFDLRKGRQTQTWMDEAKAIEVAKTIGCDITTQKAKSVAAVRKEFGNFVIDALEKQGCIVHNLSKETLKQRE